MSASPISAVLVDRRVVLPGQRLDSFHAPQIAAAARAGQLVAVLPDAGVGPGLRRAFAIAGADPASGHVAVQARDAARRGDEPLRRLRIGEAAQLAGPIGRPFDVDPRSSHLLLIAEGEAVGALRMLAWEAVRDGRHVTVLFGAATARGVYPSTELPDEAEYVVATADGSMGQPGSVADLVPGYEAWADQAFAAGPPVLLARLASLAASRRARMGVAKLGRRRGSGKVDPAGSSTARRKSFLQVVLPPDLLCAEATCLGCVVAGTPGAGLLRACREGPPFASDELDWEVGG